MAKALPSKAEVVIVGGGIIGCSIAYHLTKIGITDVVLLERKQLTCGTTWHAAGLVGQLRATRNMTELAKYTTELLETLEDETGQATGFKQNGSLSVATHEGRLEELKRGASMASNFGLDVQVVSTGEIKERWPLINLDGAVGGVFLPNDGQTNPIDTTNALAAGARKPRGADFREHQCGAHCRRRRLGQGCRHQCRRDPGGHRRPRRRHVVALHRRGDRGRHPASCRRTFLHRHRTDRGPAA